VIHRRDTLRASKIMADRALAHPKIEFIWNTAVVGAGRRALETLVLRKPRDARDVDVRADALFIAIGHDPNTAIFRRPTRRSMPGYIESPDGVHTNVPGVFVAGDVNDIRYKQAITAAGMGCKASLEAEGGGYELATIAASAGSSVS
jgi:thioredoxin reductase (NADPH)